MSEGFAVLIAAVLSAAVAVVGLVISKENKISEFRQQWIDGLRADVSALIGTVSANLIGQHNEESARALIATTSEYRCRIHLRFKKDDEDAVKLLEAVDELARAAATWGRQDILNHASQLQLETQELLKSEWEGVKKGELRYQQTLRFAYAGGIAAAIFLSIVSFKALFSAVVVPLIAWFIALFKG